MNAYTMHIIHIHLFVSVFMHCVIGVLAGIAYGIVPLKWFDLTLIMDVAIIRGSQLNEDLMIELSVVLTAVKNL